MPASDTGGASGHAAWALDVEDGIAQLVLDVPGARVNTLGTAVMTAFEAILADLAARDDVRAVVLASGKPDGFIAGADLDEIEALPTAEEAAAKARFGQRVFAAIENLGKPVVAAVHGACLGGGCELVLACHHRILSDDVTTRIGLPEVRLGILPGFGGTQRLPRVVGLQAALDMILSSRLLDARRALKLGLADEVTYPALLRRAATAAARRLAERGRWSAARPARRPWWTVPGFLDRTPLGQAIVLRTARRRVRSQTHGHYPAPLAAIDAVARGLRAGGRAFEYEAQRLGELAVSEVSRNLVRIFRWTEANKKLGRDLPEPHPVHQVGVIGAGVMGGGIAHLAASRDLRVRLKDIDRNALLVALRTARDLTRRHVRRRRLDPRTVDNRMARITTTLDDSGFELADVVIEAVVEKLEVKQQVFRDLETRVRPDCVLATNTSSLPITTMSEALRDPGRLIGMHFFNPVHRMPLVEVITTRHTRPEVVSTILALARTLGKTPVLVQDGPGFLVNRILAPYMNESAVLFEEGQDLQRIDRIFRDYGMPMGPFELLDEVGTDVGAKVGVILERELGPRMRAAGLADRLAQAGRLGRKCGVGVYRYPKGDRDRRPDPHTWETLRGAPRAADLPAEAIRDRVLGRMLDEAARCLEEHIVASPADLDLALVFGIGFPPFRGGLLRDADRRGLRVWVEALERLEREVDARFAPCALLRQRAAAGQGFHDAPVHEPVVHGG